MLDLVNLLVGGGLLWLVYVLVRYFDAPKSRYPQNPKDIFPDSE